MYLPIPVVVGSSRRPPVVGSRTSWNPTGGTGNGSGTIGSTGMGAEKKDKIKSEKLSLLFNFQNSNSMGYPASQTHWFNTGRSSGNVI